MARSAFHSKSLVAPLSPGAALGSPAVLPICSPDKGLAAVGRKHDALTFTWPGPLFFLFLSWHQFQSTNTGSGPRLSAGYMWHMWSCLPCPSKLYHSKMPHSPRDMPPDANRWLFLTFPWLPHPHILQHSTGRPPPGSPP